jgi:hypothetical protein
MMPKIDHIFSSDLMRAYNTATLSLDHGPDTATGVDGKIYLGIWCIFERRFRVMICLPSRDIARFRLKLSAIYQILAEILKRNLNSNFWKYVDKALPKK